MFNPRYGGVQESDIYSKDIQQMKDAAYVFKEALRSSEILHEYLY